MPRLTRGNLLATLKELKSTKRRIVPQVLPAAVQGVLPVRRISSTPKVVSKPHVSPISNISNYQNALQCNGPELLRTLTTLHDFRMPYSGEQKGELFIHWFYRKRTMDRLSKCEIFHLNMLQYFNVVDRVEVIHIRCAATNDSMTKAMFQAVEILSRGRATVDFKIVPQKKSWEHDTLRECVEYAVDEDKFVYYTHFKGVSRIVDDIFADHMSRSKYGELDVLYWSYLLYKSLFQEFAPEGTFASILKDGCNKSYRNGKYDCSWTTSKVVPDHHYAGSFQAFDGRALYRKFYDLGMSRIDRASKLWVNDPYTVEMFLSLCNESTEVAFSHLGIGLSSYNLYKNRQYRDSYYKFINLYNQGIPKFEAVMGKYVVLTYLYGSQTMLREPSYIDEGVEYVCITDRSDIVSKHWKVVKYPMPYLQDDRLRVAYVKFHPFEFVKAEKVLVLDASYHICDSLMPLFQSAAMPIMLLPHLYRSRIRDELNEWVRLGRMTLSQLNWFKTVVPYLGGNLDEPLYELSASVWDGSEVARRLGIETYAVVEYNGFPSNQMPCSILAHRHFKAHVGAIAAETMKGLRKYKHNSWTPCSKQSYVAV